MAERVGIEPTSARSRTDNGFEDRGDHQAPFTLREKFRPLAGCARRSGATRRRLQSLDGLQHGVGLRECSRGPLGIHQFIIRCDLEHSAGTGHQFQGRNALLQLQKLVRQTDGLRLVISSRAIFYAHLHGSWKYTPGSPIWPAQCGLLQIPSFGRLAR